MNRNKLSYYASYVAIACGLLIISLRFFSPKVTNSNMVMGLIFITVGMIGLRRFRQ